MAKYVCGRCFEDEFVVDFIAENAKSNICSYCGNKSNKAIAADISDVASFIEEGLRSEYGYAVDCLPYESREGGFQGTTYDTYELLDEQAELGIENQELLEDLAAEIEDELWCDYHPFGLAKDKELAYDWERFSNILKHGVRHVFFRLEEKKVTGVYGEKQAKPYEILYRIGELVKEFGLSKTLKPGESFFRARLHASERFSRVADLGPPRKEITRYANRFSPAGIPMFYGALDVETAIAEVYYCPKKPKRIVSVGRFENVQALRMLDLSELPHCPGIFNGQTQDERAPLRFLHDFVRDSTKLIEKDGREHVDYVPTQVVTEFFRHILTDSDGKHFDGLLYQSVRCKEGVCCVIFCSDEACTEDLAELKRWGESKKATLSLDTKATVYRCLT